MNTKASVLGATLLVLGLALSGCDNTTITKQDMGLAAGGVLGGVAGHAIGGNTASTVAGAVGGAFLGSQVGKHYDNN